MQRGIEYDNIYVGTSEDAAYELAENWTIRHEYEKLAMKASGIDGGDDVIKTFYPKGFKHLT